MVHEATRERQRDRIQIPGTDRAGPELYIYKQADAFDKRTGIERGHSTQMKRFKTRKNKKDVKVK